jgi:hypothetical protein
MLIYVCRFIHTTNDDVDGQGEGEDDDEGMYMCEYIDIYGYVETCLRSYVRIFVHYSY